MQQPTLIELRRVAEYLLVNSKGIALSEVRRGDGFALEALAFELRKVADILHREAARNEAKR